jgi:threonine dehydratase
MDNRLTFPMCRDLLDDVVLVTEPEIYSAMQALFHADRLVAEGACVVGLAALLARRLPDLRGPVGTIITGRNVDMDQFTRVVTGQDIRLGDLLVKGTAHGA